MHCEKKALAILLLDRGRMVLDASGEVWAVRLSDNQESIRIRDINISVNLCMCLDCHGIFKHASDVFACRVICQDPSRTHVFVEGKCSCKDYWPGNRLGAGGSARGVSKIEDTSGG